VLNNLLSNAIKFSPMHTVVRLRVHPTLDGLEFSVIDQGQGIRSEEQSKLFGAFQRLHGTADFPGTGIGLATVQRIIQRHSGRVWATGEVDKGATFYFTLPWEQASEDGAGRNDRA